MGFTVGVWVFGIPEKIEVIPDSMGLLFPSNSEIMCTEAVMVSMHGWLVVIQGSRQACTTPYALERGFDV